MNMTQPISAARSVMVFAVLTVGLTADVLLAPISTAEKLMILRSWENEAHQLQAATEENMTGGEPSRLEEIRKVIDRLEKEEEASEQAKYRN